MRYIFFLTLIITLISACKKDESDPAIVKEKNSIADDLKTIISQEKIQALQHCCVNCTGCWQSFGWGTDYSFPGDNFVRIQSTSYNLNKLAYYEIKTEEDGNKKEKRLVLYFPE